MRTSDERLESPRGATGRDGGGGDYRELRERINDGCQGVCEAAPFPLNTQPSSQALLAGTDLAEKAKK
jgi:hypothetical protein